MLKLKYRLILIVCIIQLISLPLGSVVMMTVSHKAVEEQSISAQNALRLLAFDLEKKTDLDHDAILAMLSNNSHTLEFTPETSLSDHQMAKLDRGMSVLSTGILKQRMYFLFGDRLAVIRSKPMSINVKISVLSGFLANLIMLIIAIAFIGQTSKRITSPFVEFAQATKRVAQGDFGVSLSSKGFPGIARAEEIESLIQNFNDMVKELRSVEYLRRDFVGNVSHELKSPVASIGGYARLLRYEGLSNEEHSEYVAAIEQQCRHLAHLSDNLLNLTRLESQEIAPVNGRFLLSEQLRREVAAVGPLADKKGLALSVETTDIAIIGCEQLLAQVWQNLLQNAIKFTPTGGNICVKAARKGSDVCVSVSDSGIGIDEEVQKSIFEKFYQVDKSRHTGGNGLGLALVKRIVDICGGAVAVSSHIGEGSTFTVTIPTDFDRAARV